METENHTVDINNTEIEKTETPVVSEQPVSEQPVNDSPTEPHSTEPRPRRGRKAVVLTVLLLLVALAMFWSWWLFGRNTNYNEDKTINSKEFQAVFLTNGQVYFGKLTDLNHKYVTLTDIYYLQVQTADGSLQNASSSTTTNSQVSLAKLGSELHGPEDKMSISSQQVLFWENLKSGSKVSQAISKYQQ